VVLKIDLDNFVAQSEHGRMISAHPLLDINTSGGNSDRLNIFRLRTALYFRLVEIRLEMFKQSYFFGNLFWVILETVL
jgi:hypothetical protein